MLSEKHAVFVYERIDETYFNFGEYVDLSRTNVSRLIAAKLIETGFKISNDLLGLVNSKKTKKEMELHETFKDYIDKIIDELNNFNHEHVLTEISTVMTGDAHVYIIVEYIPKGHYHG